MQDDAAFVQLEGHADGCSSKASQEASSKWWQYQLKTIVDIQALKCDTSSHPESAAASTLAGGISLSRA